MVALAAPSAITLYGARPDMADALVIGISQSGRSPDIVAVLEEARRQGALTVALTNAADSPLADVADHVIDVLAGPELATAATKTYTTEVLAAALLSTALDPPTPEETRDLAGLPALVAAALTEEPHARDLAVAHADRQRAVVLGRGYSYASAREWALKLQELALIAAMPYSAADFEHGPLALAEAGLPVLAVAPSGPELEAQLALAGPPQGGPRRPAAGHLGRGRRARARRGAGPAGRHPALAGPDRRDRARPALCLSPDRRARPRSRASALDPQGHRDALSR